MVCHERYGNLGKKSCPGDSHYSVDIRIDGGIIGPSLLAGFPRESGSFGRIFFGSGLLRSTLNCSGESLVRAVTGDYVQVSYHGAAFNAYFTMVLLISQVGLAFAPLLIYLLSRGETAGVRGWIERLALAVREANA